MTNTIDLNKNKPKIALKIGSKTINSIKQEMSNETLQRFDKEHENNLLGWASELYKNQYSLQQESSIIL